MRTFSWKVFHRADAPSVLRGWIEQHTPDCVLGFPGRLFPRLQRSGFDVPRDFAFAAVDVDARRLDPPISGSGSAVAEQGQAAARQLHRLLKSGERGTIEHPVELALTPPWIEGATLPRRG